VGTDEQEGGLDTVDEQRPEPIWRELDDATLLLHLRQALRAQEEPPARVVELAKASFGLRHLDAELARLVADSFDEVTGPRVRSVRAPRLVSFEAPGMTVEVELAPTGSGWRLVGQLDPPGPARIEVRAIRGLTGGPGSTPPDQAPLAGSPGVTEADRLGRFALDVVEAGPVSLLCHRPDERPVVTTWVLLG
jgi:hypothetical protein